VGGYRIAACTTKGVNMAESTKKEKTVAKTKKAKLEKIQEEVEVKEESTAAEVTTEVVEEVPVTEEKPEKTAKAGKRSVKALKETEEKIAKEERKSAAATDEATEKPKIVQKPSKTRLERKGKNYRKLVVEITKDKTYELSEALALAIKTNPSKFDATVELHVRLGVDPRQADQNIRDNVILPSGSGKSLKVAVYGEDDTVAAAKNAGADLALGDELLQQLEKSITDFDILITTPSMMLKLSKYARFLGPKGLMPNPKNGTVTTDIEKAVNEAKAGKVEYRIDSTGIVHLGIGKVSFGSGKLLINAQTVLASIKANKPSSLKGNYVNSVFVTTSMGPSIPVDKNI
jgi:large subunit ribosomal protein L1